MMKLYIKNMVCFRCQKVVAEELIKLGAHPIAVELGEAEISEDLSDAQLQEFRMALLASRLDLVKDKKSILVQKIKDTIIRQVRYTDEALNMNFSKYLSLQLGYDYTYMSNLFSERSGITIEKFYICHKIERVKELLIYEELSLKEISFKLHYSSVAHLCNQFKKVTGLTPSGFKLQKSGARSLLENY